LGQFPAEWFPRLRLVWADQKYHNHGLYVWMHEYAHYQPEIVRRPEGAKGFVLLPKR
jgi:putative transposase